MYMADDRQLRSLLLSIAADLPVGDPTRRQILDAMQTTLDPQVPVEVAPPVVPSPAPVMMFQQVPVAVDPQVPVTMVPQMIPQMIPQTPGMVPQISVPVTVQNQAPPPVVVQAPGVESAPPPGSTGEGPVGPPTDPVPIQTRRAFENEFLPEMERMMESMSPDEIRQTFLDLIDTAMRTKNDYYVTLKYYQALNQTDFEFFDGLKRVIREWQT